MRISALATPLWCILLFCSCAQREQTAETSAERRMVQYLAGIEVLGGIEATDDERARHFRQLSRLTGVTAPEAQAFIDKCKRDPRQWKRIHDRIVQHIAAEQPTEKESGDGE